jgi:hypothetical protein
MSSHPVPSWHDCEHRMGRALSPVVLVLCLAALALLVAIPLVLALVGFFGVVGMRVGASPRHGLDRNPLPTEERPSDSTVARPQAS